MPGRIVLLPHIYTKIMLMLGGPPTAAQVWRDNQAGLTYETFRNNVRRLNERKVWSVIIGDRQAMMGQVPQHREPRVVQNWMEPTRPEDPPIIITTTRSESQAVQTTDINLLKEYQRSVRRLVYLMREKQSMKLLQNMLLFLRKYTKTRPSSDSPAWDGGTDSIPLQFIMGLGKSESAIRMIDRQIRGA